MTKPKKCEGCKYWDSPCGGDCKGVVSDWVEVTLNMGALRDEVKALRPQVVAERERARSLYYQTGHAYFRSDHLDSLVMRLAQYERMVRNMIVTLRSNKIPIWVCPKCSNTHPALDKRAATRLCPACLASEPDPWAEEKK